MTRFHSAVAAGLLLCTAGLAGADVVQLSPIQDNTLYEHPAGALSNGAGAHLFVGRTGEGLTRRGVILFDVASAVPPGSSVISASLRMNMSMTSSGPLEVSLHRLQDAWGEASSDAPGGEGGGAPAAAGDATWLHRFFNGTPWSSPGGDFVPVASAAASVAGPGPYTWTSAQLAADVADMAAQPANNFGWILVGDESMVQTTKRFDSRQNADESVRPVLIIEYDPPVPVPAVSAPGVGVLVGLLIIGLAARAHRCRSIRRAG